MHLTHVLVGKSEPISAKSGLTGINKKPQAKPVALDAYGLKGDAIVDTDNHGGLTQAVYIFGQNDYDFWADTLGRPLSPGTFGENLIISDLSTHDVNQGDTFTIGEVVLKITYPRIPCVTLTVRMNDPDFGPKFSKTGHVGIYCSVKTAGLLTPDTAVRHDKTGTEPLLKLLPGYRF